MTPQTYRFRMIRGNDYNLIVDYVDTEGDPIDLTSNTVELQFYRGSEDVSILVVTDGDGLTIEAIEGRTTIVVTADQVDAMFDFKDARYELKLTDLDRTFLTGRVDIKVAGV